MAFFDNISKKASEATAKAVQKAQDLSETAKLNGMISDEEKQINTAYSQIGKLYVELHREDGEAAFAELLGVIRDAEEKISSYRKQLQDMKEGLRCRKCGAAVSRDSAFCSACGAKIEEKDADGPQCEKCGAPVTGWMRFCTACGNPLPQPAVVESALEDGAEDTSMAVLNMDDDLHAKSKRGTEQPVDEPTRSGEIETAGAKTEEMSTPLEERNVQADLPETRTADIPQKEKRICPHCGAEVEDDQLFCVECGNSL